jgi:hypothetical protein
MGTRLEAVEKGQSAMEKRIQTMQKTKQTTMRTQRKLNMIVGLLAAAALRKGVTAGVLP